ncbi:MAG: NADH-quinone oxidoreductase subunit A [Acidobacteria bacterium]|nr:NADH-quinone oxidoreductase subunit A [Acidobacteriota bacterium]
MEGWGGVALMVLLGSLVGLGGLVVSNLLGPKNPTPEKEAAYECGMPPVGDARERQSVKFYLVAMIFLLFDIEVAFLYPWAMAMRTLGWVGLVQITVFFAILLVGYVYIWRKGVLDWGPESDPDYKHTPRPGPAVVKRYRYGTRN